MNMIAKMAQARPNGTVIMTMTAAKTLSNCADSTSSTTSTAKPKVMTRPLLVITDGLGLGQRQDGVAGRQDRRRNLQDTLIGVAQRITAVEARR